MGIPNAQITWSIPLLGVSHQVSLCGTICWSSWMHPNVPLCRPTFSTTWLAVYEFQWQQPEPNGFVVWCWHGDSRKSLENNPLGWKWNQNDMWYQTLSAVMPGLYLYMSPSQSEDSAGSCATGRSWCRVASTLCFEVFIMGSNKCWDQFSFSM